MSQRSTVDIIRGNEQVSELEARQVLALLVPLLQSAEEDPEARDAAIRVIGRMDPQAALTALADWWLVVSCDTSPVTPLVYHPPDTLTASVREAMAELLALNVTVPRSRWVREAARYEACFAELEARLDLEYYGQSRLSQERIVWDEMLDTRAPVLDALRSGSPAPDEGFDAARYERSMTKVDITKGSRRWVEMLKRARELDEFLSVLCSLQRTVEPWERRDRPTRRTVADLGLERADRLELTLLSPLLDVAMEPTPTSEIVEALEDAASTTDEQGKALLCQIADSWLAVNQVNVPSLTSTMARLAAIEQERARLERSGVDLDEVDLALLDHDLAAAEAAIAALTTARETAELTARQRAAIERLRARLEDVAEVAVSDLVTRLGVVEGLIDSQPVDSTASELADIENVLRERVEVYVVNRLRNLHADLDRLEAPTEILDEIVEQEGQAMRGNYAQLSAVRRFEDFIEARRIELIAEAGANAAEAAERLAAAGDTLQQIHRTELEESLEDIKDRLATLDERSDLDDIVAVHADTEELRSEIDRRRLRRWRSSEGEAVLVDHIVEFCTQQLSFDEDDILKFYVALKTKPFVIIAGLTGTGKSTIVRLFAEAIGATTANSGFRRVAVRPDWIDQAEVIGFVNPMTRSFEPGWLADTVQRCNVNPDRMFVVLLDEMNLAPAEQYLAEFLSAGEEFRSGSSDVRIPLYNAGNAPINSDVWPADLAFPSNLLVVGTVNMDETTRVLSERVLDRANVIQLSVDVNEDHHGRTQKFVQPWTVPAPEWRRLVSSEPSDLHHSFLVDLATLMRSEMGIGLGVRSHIEIERFISNSEGVLDPIDALDLSLLQRLIPKIRGFKRDLVGGLARLREEFESAGCDRCVSVIDHWMSSTVSDDEFLDGTAARIGLIT